MVTDHVMRRLRSQSGEPFTVHVFDSLGGNLLIVHGDRVLVLAQGDAAEEDALAQAGWEAAKCADTRVSP